MLAAKRHALTQGREPIGRDDLAGALDDFIPSAQGLEKEKQELAAVLECTSMSFLPEEWQSRIAETRGAGQAPGTDGRDPAADRRMNGLSKDQITETRR